MGLSPSDASGNATVAFADAIVRVLGVELRGLCRLRQRAPEHHFTPFAFGKWDTQKAAGSQHTWTVPRLVIARLYDLSSFSYNDKAAALNKWEDRSVIAA
jgi:hypothetical protein